MKNKGCKKKVIKHLKGDIKNFKKEASEDRELIKSLHKKDKEPKEERYEKKDSIKDAPKENKNKIKKVMHEFKEGELHSGSKNGPVVTNPKQAIAISLSEAKRKKRK
jgi:hypothetical protein